MLVYDITNEKSFENIRTWVRNIEEVSSCCICDIWTYDDLWDKLYNIIVWFGSLVVLWLSLRSWQQENCASPTQ